MVHPIPGDRYCEAKVKGRTEAEERSESVSHAMKILDGVSSLAYFQRITSVMVLVKTTNIFSNTNQIKNRPFNGKCSTWLVSLDAMSERFVEAFMVSEYILLSGNKPVNRNVIVLSSIKFVWLHELDNTYWYRNVLSLREGFLNASF